MKAIHQLLLSFLVCIATPGKVIGQRTFVDLPSGDAWVYTDVTDETMRDPNLIFYKKVWRELDRSNPRNRRLFSDSNATSISLLDVILRYAKDSAFSTYEMTDDSTARPLPFDSIEARMTSLAQAGLCTSAKNGAKAIGDCAISFELMETWTFLLDSGKMVHRIQRLGPVVQQDDTKRTGSRALFYVDYQKCRPYLDSAFTVSIDGTRCSWTEYMETLQFYGVITRISQPDKMEMEVKEPNRKSRRKKKYN